ncbi:MAG: prepilin-type N-terminal cleavage/methylation domain-containing protein [Candidatus Omnitrophota bacterium]
MYSKKNFKIISITGFTLVEVMAATMILSLGLVLIYQSFFLSLDIYNYYSDYLAVSSFAGEKICEAEVSLERYGDNASPDTSGVFNIRNRLFNWKIDYDRIGEEPDLYKIEFNTLLKRGSKKIKFSRYAYVLHEEETLEEAINE